MPVTVPLRHRFSLPSRHSLQAGVSAPQHVGSVGGVEAVQQGAHLIGGFRNRAIRQCLFGAPPRDDKTYRQQSNKVGRYLALLRAHGLIRKVTRTHRYQLTTSGGLSHAAIPKVDSSCVRSAGPD